MEVITETCRVHYLMEVITETCRVHYLWYLRFYYPQDKAPINIVFVCMSHYL